MPNAAKRPHDERRAIPPIDVASLPDQYALLVSGDALAPDHPAGTCMVFDKNEPYERGDYVVLYQRQDLPSGPSGPCVFRVYVGCSKHLQLPCRVHPDSEAIPVLIVEQCQPPKRYSIELTQLEAVHKCIRTQPAPQVRP